MKSLFDLPCDEIRIVWVDPVTKIILAATDGRKNHDARVGSIFAGADADIAHIGTNKLDFLADPRIDAGRVIKKGFYAIFVKQKIGAAP